MLCVCVLYGAIVSNSLSTETDGVCIALTCSLCLLIHIVCGANGGIVLVCLWMLGLSVPQIIEVSVPVGEDGDR